MDVGAAICVYWHAASSQLMNECSSRLVWACELHSVKKHFAVTVLLRVSAYRMLDARRLERQSKIPYGMINKLIKTIKLLNCLRS